MKIKFLTLATFSLLLNNPLQGQENSQNQMEQAMTVNKIVKKETMYIVGIEARTENKPGKADRDIPTLVERFLTEDIINKIPNKASNEVIALYCDYEGDYTKPYTVVYGCQVNSLEDVPEGMVAKTIPKSSYAVFTPQGEFPNSLIAQWQDIWKNHDENRTYGGDFEVYGEGFFQGESQELNLYIGVEDQN